MLEKKQKGDLVYWEDEYKYGVCSWCPKKEEVEQYLRYVQLLKELHAVTQGVEYTQKGISHIICEVHLKQMMEEYFGKDKKDDK